jgi:hypothetical protein
MSADFPGSDLLDNLKEHLDDIESSWDWAYTFITDLMEKREKGQITRLTDKQFMWVTRIHDQYVHGIQWKHD